MKLYSYYRSTASYRLRIALNLKGIAFEYVSVHLVRNGGEQNSAEYKKLNPQAQVPTLIDGDTVITQSLAAIEYLQEKHPNTSILPQDAEKRAYVRQIAQICACDIQPLNTLRVLTHLSAELSATQAQKNEWQQRWMLQGLEALEKIVASSPYRTGPYACGDSPTIADICIVPQLDAARRADVPTDRFSALKEIEEHCLKLKAFQDASPECQPDTPDDQRPAILKR